MLLMPLTLAHLMKRIPRASRYTCDVRPGCFGGWGGFLLAVKLSDCLSIGLLVECNLPVNTYILEECRSQGPKLETMKAFCGLIILFDNLVSGQFLTDLDIFVIGIELELT